jgi:hypothetical protein
MRRRPTDRGWSTKLSRPFTLKDGTTLTTLADARSFILRQPAHISRATVLATAAELMRRRGQNHEHRRAP